MKAMTRDQQKEAMELLGAARNEIMNLREQVAQLEIKARAFDTLERYAQLSQTRGGGQLSVDSSWQIQRFMQEVNQPNPGASPATEVQA